MTVVVFCLLVICALGYLGALLTTPKPAPRAQDACPICGDVVACRHTPIVFRSTPLDVVADGTKPSAQERFDAEGLPRGTWVL